MKTTSDFILEEEQATVGALLSAAGERLRECSDSARLDAELLLRHVTGLSATELIIQSRESLKSALKQRFLEVLQRRLGGEPMAYILGEREFWSMSLKVTPATLIPRPETELLVEQALAVIPPKAAWHIADLGTGSGAVALALAGECPDCRIIATDQSAEALAVAEENVRNLGISNVRFVQAAWLEFEAEARFDLIASNPPYVAVADPCLHKGDVRFEPLSALASGADGLDDIRVIIRQATGALRKGGWLMLECGHDQGAAVRLLMEQAGFGGTDVVPDIAGRDRVVRGFLNSRCGTEI